MTEFVLEILDGERAGEVVSLDSDRITMGRRPSNDVALKDEKASGQHAEVVREGPGFVLRDLESTNGTLMDGRRITEVVLSPGDVFHVGRTRVCFRRAGDPTGAAAGDLTVHRVDQARLQRVRRGGGTVGLLAVLAVVIGAGVWVWLRYGSGATGEGGRRGRRGPVAIAGNLLPAGTAACETEEGWDLAAAGSGFVVGGPGASGTGALEATAGEGGAPFALARIAAPVTVLGGDALRLEGQLRAAGGGRGALRVRFSSSLADDEIAVTAGTVPGGGDDWTAAAVDVSVPQGMDRAQVEVVALLADADAAVWFDDVALVKGGAGKRLEGTAKNGVRMLGAGSDLVLRVADDILVGGLRPVADSGPVAALAAAGLAVPSDAGTELSASSADDRFGVEVRGGGGLALLLPSAGGALGRAAADEPFTPRPPELDAQLVELLVGSGPTRLEIRLPAPGTMRGARLGDDWLLALPGAESVELVVSFDESRRQAREAIRVAREAIERREFARALDTLQHVVDHLPHDDATAGEAVRLRGELLGELNQRLDALEAELDTALFFSARSALVRIGSDLDDLRSRYGEANIVRLDLLQRLRTQAGTAVAAIDEAAFARRKDSLERLQDGLAASGQTAMAELVAGFLKSRGGNN